MSKEKVIFRKEKNPYTGRTQYLAVFPEDPANPCGVAAVAFDSNDGHVWFEPFCEIVLDYYYKHTKLIHKNTEEAQKCLDVLQKYYNTEFQVVEKITNRW